MGGSERQAAFAEAASQQRKTRFESIRNQMLDPFAVTLDQVGDARAKYEEAIAHREEMMRLHETQRRIPRGSTVTIGDDGAPIFADREVQDCREVYEYLRTCFLEVGRMHDSKTQIGLTKSQ
jgi:hypothetical protein